MLMNAEETCNIEVEEKPLEFYAPEDFDELPVEEYVELEELLNLNKLLVRQSF